MQCDSCKFATSPQPLEGIATGEVVICSQSDQYRAAMLERNCIHFEKKNLNGSTNPIWERIGRIEERLADLERTALKVVFHG